MTGVDARLAALEDDLHRVVDRVRQVEDELAITRIVLGYGPLVDSGSSRAAAQLWAQDGSYEFQADVAPLNGRDALAAMVDSAPHHRHLARGCAHVLSAPHVVISGDRAVATCYSLMHHFVPDTGIFQVSRVSANRWEFERRDGHWLVTVRTNRLLNGSDDARELLARLGETVPLVGRTGGADAGA